MMQMVLPSLISNINTKIGEVCNNIVIANDPKIKHLSNMLKEKKRYKK